MTAIEILRVNIENDKAVVEHFYTKLLTIIDDDEKREYIADIEEYNVTISNCERAIKILEGIDE